MVRNMPSMQSLRSSSSVADLSPQQMELNNTSPDPTAKPKSRGAEDELQRLGIPTTIQLRGRDAYTKDIMTKMATGKATQAEQTAFNDRVREARSMPSIQNLLRTEDEAPRQACVSDVEPANVEKTQPPPEHRSSDGGLADIHAPPVPETSASWDAQLPLDDLMRSLSLSIEALRQPEAQRLAHARSMNKQEQALGRGIKPEESPSSADLARRYAYQLEQLQKQDPVLQYLRRGSIARTASPPKVKIQKATRQNAAKYTDPFCSFLTDNPTVFHAVSAMKKDLKDAGWTELSERDSWSIKPSGSYFVERNGSSLIAFTVGSKYKSGNGAAILAGHVDALTARLKPISAVPNKAGYLQLGVAPYAGGLNSTWWDRDLGIGGRVHIKEGNKIVTKLVKLDWPIAKIPTLAPHFGAAAQGPFNPETQMVPIIGLDSTSAGPFQAAEPFSQPSLLCGAKGSIGSFVHTQPPALVKVIAEALGLNTNSIENIVNWELELFDVQPATVGGLNKEFIYAGRIDDKLCSWAALQALIESQATDTDSSLIKVVGLFDDEEIGSLLRQGARGNLLPTVIERAVGSLADHNPSSDLMGRTYANSFLVSSDVTHAVNPNFLNAYLENHAPHLNVGVAVAADSNGHMTTDSVSTTILQRCAELADAKLQVFQIRNDSRSGGTVGPMLSSALGVRAIDAGLPQLSMHSIRATTGSLDPGLGVILFRAFLSGFEGVDGEFR